MSIKKMITFSLSSVLLTIVGSMATLVLISQSVIAADLTVNISEVNQGKGHVLVGLYSGEQAYIQGKTSFGSRVKATNEQEQVVFKDVPDGEYAIKIYQDENSNQKLDFNIMGIPKEGYGYSNNVVMFGTPDYQEAKFIIKDKTEIAIELF